MSGTAIEPPSDLTTAGPRSEARSIVSGDNSASSVGTSCGAGSALERVNTCTGTADGANECRLYVSRASARTPHSHLVLSAVEAQLPVHAAPPGKDTAVARQAQRMSPAAPHRRHPRSAQPLPRYERGGAAVHQVSQPQLPKLAPSPGVELRVRRATRDGRRLEAEESLYKPLALPPRLRLTCPALVRATVWRQPPDTSCTCPARSSIFLGRSWSTKSPCPS